MDARHMLGRAGYKSGGHITAAKRHSLPASDFAIPEREAYPVDTAGRARNALSRVSQNGSPEEKARVRAKVKRDWPSIQQSKEK